MFTPFNLRVNCFGKYFQAKIGQKLEAIEARLHGNGNCLPTTNAWVMLDQLVAYKLEHPKIPRS